MTKLSDYSDEELMAEIMRRKDVTSRRISLLNKGRDVLATFGAMENITTTVCEFYRLQKRDLVGVRRQRNIATARHVAIYLCRKHTGFTYEEISRFFNRDHSSTRHAIESIKHRMAREDLLVSQVSSIEKNLGFGRP